MKRSLPDWLKAFAQCIDNTEAPEHFWLWGGIYTIGAAMNRNVWVPYGIDNIHPNLYVLFIAPPGKCRKGGPVGMSKKMLRAIGVNVAVDSTSKEALTKELHDNVRVIDLPELGTQQQCTLSVISKELSSLLAIDAKKMIECLTDLFDDHDIWEYKTKGGRADKLYNPGLNMFAATTPNYVANNLPYEAFGAGFFSRVLCVVGTEKKQRVTFPTIDADLLHTLTQDLHLIETTIRGPVRWTERGKRVFDGWYQGLDGKYQDVQDDRFHGFIERSHIQVLKVATVLSANQSDVLELNSTLIGQAIDLVESIYTDLDDAFAGLGRADLSVVTHMLRKQLERKGSVKLSELTRWNLRNISLDEMGKGLQQLHNSKMITISYGDGDKIITWKG